MKLSNKEIWLAFQAFQRLGQIQFPIRTAFLLAKAASVVDKPGEAIEKLRQGLVKKHAKRAEGGHLIPLVPGSPEWEAFNEEWLVLLEIDDEVGELHPKVKLPEKIAATCEQCKHNMDRPLELEPVTLAPLWKHFVEPPT